MPAIDLHSVILAGTFIVFICTLLMVELWRQNRRRFPGLLLLAGAFILQTLGMILIMLRGTIADWLSIMVAGVAIVGGALAGLEGLERFFGQRSRLWPKLALLTLFVLVHFHFTFWDNQLRTRTVNIAAALLIVSLQCVWLLTVRVEPVRRSQTRMVALVYISYIAIFLYRILSLLTHPASTNEYLRTGSIEAGFHLVWQIQFILLTYAAALMVNHRLVAAVEAQEEKFSKAFHCAPYAITITRQSDGTLLDVNDGFGRITGYQTREVIGKTTLELDVWVNIEDRQLMLSSLKERGSFHGREIRFRRKSGEILTGLFSAETIVIGGEVCILSSINDITDRQRAEEERARLLNEKEKVLSEVKVLSGLLPICAWCKKIRDDQGYWNQIEAYINSHSEAEFSHSICPDCMKKYYGERRKPKGEDG